MRMLQLNSPDITWSVMKELYTKMEKQDKIKELFWTISLTKMWRILDIELVAMSSYAFDYITPLEVLSVPLQKRAYSIIMVHNSLNGELKPSEEMCLITDRIIQAARMMHLDVEDHLKITENSFFSFAQTGLLDELEDSERYVAPYELRKQHEKEFKAKLNIARDKLREKEESFVLRGRKEGILEGKEQGIAIGEERGILKGQKEGKSAEKKAIAQQMLSKGYAIQDIVALTGLTRKVIEALAAERQ